MPNIKRAKEILKKTATEERIIELDWSDNPDLATGETLSSVGTPTCSPTGLTITDATVSGTTCQMKITGGTANTSYIVAALVTTTNAQKLLGEIMVKVY